MGCLRLKPDAGFRFVRYAALSLLLLGSVQSKNTSCITPSLPARSQIWQGDDFVKFENEPSVVIDGYSLSVRYLCSSPCVVGVEVVAPTEWRTGPLVFQKTWTNQHHLGSVRRHSLPLRFPAAMAYQTDFFVRHSIDAQDVMLRAWLDHLGRVNGSIGGLNAYHTSLTHVFRILRTVPASERPVMQHGTCLSWGPELLWKLNRNRLNWCPHESGIVPLLTFPLASTGERFGVIRHFHPFVNKELEDCRNGTTEEPRLALSLWIYLLSWCDGAFCGILQHMDWHDTFDTPMIMLDDRGDVIFQVRLVSGEARSFRSYTALPLRVWHRLDVFMDGSKVMLKVTSHATAGAGKPYTYNFQADIRYDDTAGYFMIGGGKFMPGIKGYIGPITYHRLGGHEVWNPLSPELTALGLDQTHRVCEEVMGVILGFAQALRDTEDAQHSCRSYYMGLKQKFEHLSCRAPPLSADHRHHIVLQLLKALGRNYISGSGSETVYMRLGRWSYELAKRKLARARPGSGPVSSAVRLLQVSSCCGNSQASLLLAAVYLGSLGVREDPVKGHVYSLVGAQADGRLALMHLGYKHTQGIDGFPQDYSMAYCYYSNVGRQTCADRWTVPMTQQYTTELILLTDDEALKSQMDEDDDIFQYFKFQAERGDLEAQKTLARMLLWGEQGVSKDTEGALRWYAESAMRMTDPQAMYDYSILLLKGHGKKKNRTLGLHFLEKAASMGFPEAINGMGWYYSVFMADSSTGLRYFEKAAQTGNKDAIYNLGLLYMSGKHPKKPGKNQTAAFQHFLKASGKGHLEAGIEVAWYYATGVLPAVGRDPERAVLLLKEICEQNGYLGSILRKGLNAYLRGSRVDSLLSYLLAAETGVGVAQNNAAHLCEVLIDLGQAYGCEWRYYNQSTFNYHPHPAGLLKMGDFYYEGQNNQSQDIRLSVLMYASAALAGSPQGIFNLAAMIEMGHDIPEKILEQLKVSKQDRLDRSAVLEKLYQSCRQYENQEDVTPCSLALLRVRLSRAWRTFTSGPLRYFWACLIGSGAVLLSIIILSPIRRGVMAAQSERRGAAAAPGGQGATTASGLGWQNLQQLSDWAWCVLGGCLCVVGSVLLAQIL
ncbi:protein sel-1 homolog 3 isoform X1 [Brienomyrus brachyistius]|uniref:protein sel-1 homolog 3 isoform X1 n=2 Tax=Brienomyrus brachyistius TaxID=42636 RepID=UPI0020B412DF|nr:protein sel-1 homolog 3 isoform X1 [Brienomyrus brachyistius]